MINIEGLTQHEMFLIIIGLERVRDFAINEVPSYEKLGWEDAINRSAAEARLAEDLRERLKANPNYDVKQVKLP